MSKHKFNYEWTLKDAKFTKDKGTVFLLKKGGKKESIMGKKALNIELSTNLKLCTIPRVSKSF